MSPAGFEVGRSMFDVRCSRPAIKIVSGGQTGADRAALDWAIRQGVPHGGWCPQGRLAEDGVIPARYELKETPEADYAQRTEWNVRDADGTVILSLQRELSGGSLFTSQVAVALGKPWLHLHRGLGVEPTAERLRVFLRAHQVRVLNVAGPRRSQEPEIGAFVEAVLQRALGELIGTPKNRPDATLQVAPQPMKTGQGGEGKTIPAASTTEYTEHTEGEERSCSVFPCVPCVP